MLSVFELNASQMNVQRNQIQKLILYELELGNNAAEETKNIFCAKGEGAVDHNTVTRWLSLSASAV